MRKDFDKNGYENDVVVFVLAVLIIGFMFTIALFVNNFTDIGGPTEREKIIAGEPTFNGTVNDIDITAGGGWGNTILYMDNDTVILNGQHDEFVIGHGYRIWTRENELLKYEEVF